MSTNRIEKVNSLLEHEISKILLRDFDFPQGILVTLTHVDCSANLFEAKAFVSVYPEEKFDKTLELLNRAVYSVQQKINRTLKMRPIPKIKFVKDKNVAEASKIEELLVKAKESENN